ncbi:hypothetical protein KDL29_13775 [bacterium]|nr:hypothetical protein [bacterium]
MSSGKPGYSISDLQDMTVGELKGRIGRISNQQARHIAVRLWQHVEQDSGGGDSRKSTVSRDHVSVHKIANWNQQALLNMLDQMRKVHFGQLLASDPEAFEDSASKKESNILFRPLWNTARTTFNSADKLYRNMERHAYGGRAIPGHVSAYFRLIIFLPLLVGAILLGGKLRSQYEIHEGIMFLYAVIFSFAMVGLFYMPMYLLRLHRALALYISFTDEFIDDERQYDDPAVEDIGW